MAICGCTSNGWPGTTPAGSRVTNTWCTAPRAMLKGSERAGATAPRRRSGGTSESTKHLPGASRRRFVKRETPATSGTTVVPATGIGAPGFGR